MKGSKYMIDFIREAANVKPDQKQLDWFDMEKYVFVHFGVNTFTDREWGTGDEDEKIFNPEKLDCDQWVKTIKDAGFKGLVLTAKHHDGFCLWPSKYTEHSVKNSPCTKDIVKEASEACRRGGIKFGFYLSPWDMNSEYYGTDKYNDYFCNQLTELLTNYGEIFYVWFDNACGEGPDGIKQKYDFERYFSLIRKYQPNAVIFNDFGPDIRWCGNEAGIGRTYEWSVVPTDLCYHAKSQTGKGPLADMGNLSYLYNTNKHLGELHQILYSKGLAFVPSEIDTSIRKGWFWHSEEEPKSVEKLFEIYLASVGNNACLHLNIPPNRDGLFDERDVKRMQEFSDFLNQQFGKPLAATVDKTEESLLQPAYTVKLDGNVKDISYVVLSEDIANGQRVENFMICPDAEWGNMYPFFQGNCIGHKKICCIRNPFEEQNPLIEQFGDLKSFKIVINSSRGEVNLKDIQVFAKS